jgi:hypothetical protein
MKLSRLFVPVTRPILPSDTPCIKYRHCVHKQKRLQFHQYQTYLRTLCKNPIFICPPLDGDIDSATDEEFVECKTLLDVVHSAYFFKVRQLRAEDQTLYGSINKAFIRLTATAVHHCLLVWETDTFKQIGEFGGDITKSTLFTPFHKPLDYTIPIVSFRRFEADFNLSSPIQQKIYG